MNAAFHFQHSTSLDTSSTAAMLIAKLLLVVAVAAYAFTERPQYSSIVRGLLVFVWPLLRCTILRLPARYAGRKTAK